MNQPESGFSRHVDLLRYDGLEVGIILDPPSTAELYRDYVDLIVVSDYLGFSFFSQLVDATSMRTAGFLTKERLEDIRTRYEHRAKNPSSLLELPVKERLRPRSIEQHCSLLHIGTFDRSYVRKFLLFVPSLIREDAPPMEVAAPEYMEAALYVAAAARSRAIYFAGFGGTDGSFPDDLLIALVERTLAMRRAVALPPVHVLFKYFALPGSPKVDRLAASLAQLLPHEIEAPAAPRHATHAA